MCLGYTLGNVLAIDLYTQALSLYLVASSALNDLLSTRSRLRFWTLRTVLSNSSVPFGMSFISNESHQPCAHFHGFPQGVFCKKVIKVICIGFHCHVHDLFYHLCFLLRLNAWRSNNVFGPLSRI